MIAEVTSTAASSGHKGRFSPRSFLSPTIITIAVAVLGIGGFAWGITHHHKPQPAAAASPLPSNLSNGVQIPAGSNLTPDEINELEKNSASSASAPGLTVK